MKSLAGTRIAIGLAQGLVLYLLYRAGKELLWPATMPLLFVPLLMLSIFAPVLAISGLGQLPRRRLLQWVLFAAAVMAGLAFYDVWRMEGARLPTPKPVAVEPSPQLCFFLAAGCFIAHALVLAAVEEGRRIAGYATYFETAWKLGVQLAFDVLGDPGFPERPAFELARELGLPVTTHAGVWGATNDDGIRLMHENGFATPDTVYVHAATLDTDSYLRIAASGGSVSVSTESEQSAGQGYPPTWQVRRFDIPVSLSMDTSVWWSGDLFSAMRSTLGADRAREHLEAHVAGETVTSSHLRAEHVVEWATRGGANALRRDDLGSLAVGQKADLVLIKNDHSPVSFPVLNPYGHVAFQAQRGDVHTVIIDGAVVKRDHRLVGVDLEAARRAVENTIDHLRSELGEEVWQAGMHPDLPGDDKVLDNPYTYTDYRSASTREARESIFGESAGA